MNDNIVDFPGKKGSDGSRDSTMSANDALAVCKDKFDDVIVIGLKADNAQCVSTVSLSEAIYELSRAIHILHNYIDRM